MFLFHFFFFSSSNFLIVAVNFSPADLIFSSSACTRRFILLSFADAQVSISPLTDYTSRFRSTSFRKVLFLLVSNFVRQIWLPRIFSYKSQSSECMRFGSSGFISGQVSVHTGSGPQPISLHAVPMMRESFKHFIYSIRFAIPHQPIRRSPDRSVDRSVARSIARSIARSLGRSFGRSIGRSVARSIARSLCRSVARSLGCSVDRSVDRPTDLKHS
jgi:hypothetical protein